VKRMLSIIALLVLLNLGAPAQSPQFVQSVALGAPAAAPTVRQETFDVVWRTVKEKHFDPTLGGLDWDKVREQYEPRAAEAKSDPEFYKVLRQMLGELHQSHFNIIPPEDIVEDGSREPKEGGIGIDLRIINPTSLGTMHMRSGAFTFAVVNQPNPYLGPVVILTDGSSASTSEIFAGGMQEIGRAVVVGDRTVGAALPSVFQKLPTGALFQYAIADFKTPRDTH
jgi:C-terminal processing protease CtpA/Prc